MNDRCQVVSFDYSSLVGDENGDVYARKRNKKKGVLKVVTLEKAIGLVDGLVAVVVNPQTIKMLYTRDEFNQAIREKYNFTCQNCGRKGYTVDHIVPKSKGGLRTFKNCTCLCFRCNKLKGDKVE